MIYQASIITPLNTPVNTPLHTVLKVSKGLIYRVEFFIPPGPEGDLGIAVFDGSYQVWPSSLGEWLRPNDVLISFEDTYLKMIEPFQFDIYTYNLDLVNNHFTQIRIGLVSKEAFMARFMPSLTWDKYLEVLRSIEAQQELARQEIIASPFPWIEAIEE